MYNIQNIPCNIPLQNRHTICYSVHVTHIQTRYDNNGGKFCMYVQMFKVYIDKE